MESAVLVDTDWSTSAEGKKHIAASKCFHANSANVSCGLLELPSTLLSSNLGGRDAIPKLMKYKVLACSPMGKVGKTSLVAKLCGNPTPKKHLETPGLVGHIRYWPVKVKSSGEILYFQIMLFEYGPSAEKNHPNITKLALDGCEALLVAFSLTNKNSFDMLPDYIASMKDKFVNVCSADFPPDVAVVGTHADLVQQIEVSQQDVASLKQDFPVYRMKCVSSNANVPSIALPTKEDETKRTVDSEVVSFLNSLCNMLLLRDKAALQI